MLQGAQVVARHPAGAEKTPPGATPRPRSPLNLPPGRYPMGKTTPLSLVDNVVLADLDHKRLLGLTLPRWHPVHDDSN